MQLHSNLNCIHSNFIVVFRNHYEFGKTQHVKKNCVYNEDSGNTHQDNYIMKSGSTAHASPQRLFIRLIHFV